MKDLMCILKKSVFSALAIVVLLIVQAFGELALPDYTSDIINIGIQQNGVERITPDIIRKSQLDILEFFMDDSEKSLVGDNYYVSEADYSDEYGEVCRLSSDADNETLDKLDKAFGIPMIIASQMDEMQFSAESSQNAASDINQIKAQFEDYDDSIIEQIAVSYTTAEYEALGIDMDSRQISYIVKTGVKMLLLSLIIALCSIAVTLFASRIAASASRDLRSGVFKKVIQFSGNEFNKFSTASLITRCTNDIQQLQMVIVMIFRMVLYAPIIGIGAFLKVIAQGASMSWVIGVGVISVISLVLVLLACSMPKFKILQQLVDKLNLVSREILTGLPVIRAFSREDYEKKRFDKANRELTDVNLFVSRIMTIMMPLMMFIMNGMSVLIIWVGSKQVDLGNMQVGDITAFISYTMQIIMAFLMISMMSIFLPRAMVSMKRISEVLNTDISIKDPEKPAEFDNGKKGLVEFKNVSFRYPGADENVIENISFTAKPGETTAIIGSTGSGKSTLVNLIPRFYDATEGEILLGGVNVNSVRIHDLRNQIGYVPQKGFLFSGTIASNIRYGNESASENEVENAAEISQSMDFIMEKTKKFNDDIAQGGTNVSGGQKQRLSIARAIVRNPAVYIFDDSFSALDYKTDASLRKALSDRTRESTIIIVAQRISTVLNAEQIIVLDEGRIAGIGSHKELLRTCETYRQIAGSQLSKEELAE
ncbi:MAG TPA: ABC transporter [Ruminococcus sp.]|nr:ABC transporter [Ruminococcus sp.]